MKELSIILLNYNSSDYSIACVHSILEAKNDVNYEIIIVDNDSQKKEQEKLINFCVKNNIKYILSEKNEGFASGNMIGAENTKSKYILFLNNDTLIRDGFLDTMFDFMEKNPDVGLCGGQMYNEKNVLINSFGNLPSLIDKYLGKTTARIIFPRRFKNPKKKHLGPIEVGFVSGSAMFVRRESLDEVGGLDKRFFLYCEEEDLGLMMRKINKKVYHIPNAIYIHYCHVSTGRSFEMDREFYISLNKLLKKHYHFVYRFFFKFFYFFKHLRKFYKKNELKKSLLILQGPAEKLSLRYKQ